MSARSAVLVALVALCLSAISPASAADGPIRSGSKTIKAGGRSYSVQFVKAQLSKVRVEVGLAWGKLGRTEALDGIAKRYHAAAAINGCFFDAYSSNPVRSPYHTIIKDGLVIHYGKVGTVLGFTASNSTHMGPLRMKIEGSLDGSYKHPNNWYAYNFNHYPESSTTVTIFTSWWGESTGLTGTQVAVQDGVVTRISSSSQTIPANGFVIYFKGTETKLASRFRVGRRCGYRLVRADGPGWGPWEGVQEGLGCGPRLVTDGRATVNPSAEGFSSAKVLSGSSSRSMVGVTKDGWLILATSSGTTRQMADVMRVLGAYQAMALDGGDSSGLWAGGKYLTTPGRKISNALVVTNR